MTNYAKATITPEDGPTTEVLLDLEESQGKIILPLGFGSPYIVTLTSLSAEDARQFKKVQANLPEPVPHPTPDDPIPNVSGVPFSDGNDGPVVPIVTDADEDGDNPTD